MRAQRRMALTTSAQDKIGAKIKFDKPNFVDIEAKANIDGTYQSITAPEHAQIIKDSCGKGDGKSFFDTRSKISIIEESEENQTACCLKIPPFNNLTHIPQYCKNTCFVMRADSNKHARLRAQNSCTTTGIVCSESDMRAMPEERKKYFDDKDLGRKVPATQIERTNMALVYHGGKAGTGQAGETFGKRTRGKTLQGIWYRERGQIQAVGTRYITGARGCTISCMRAVLKFHAYTLQPDTELQHERGATAHTTRASLHCQMPRYGYAARIFRRMLAMLHLSQRRVRGRPVSLNFCVACVYS